MTHLGRRESLTARTLQAGGAFASALFLAAIALHAIGSDIAERAADLGIAAIIGTPPLSLLATAVETWNEDRPTAWLALAVLAILGVATGIALLVAR